MRTVLVAAGVVVEHGKILLSRRKEGTHLAGLWEFPGGKVEPGEDPRETVRRELEEELGIRVRVSDVMEVTFHRYVEAEKSVLLMFFRAEREPTSPDPKPLDAAEVKWMGPDELDPAEFPPADVAILTKVRGLLE
jgi:8-oxo-dGTP diphosphatase